MSNEERTSKIERIKVEEDRLIIIPKENEAIKSVLQFNYPKTEFLLKGDGAVYIFTRFQSGYSISPNGKNARTGS